MNDHRILDRRLSITAEHQVTIAEWQFLGPLSVQGIDPPVLSVRSGATEIEAPTKVRRQDHKTFQRGGTERLAADLTNWLEVDAIQMTSQPRRPLRGRNPKVSGSGRQARRFHSQEHNWQPPPNCPAECQEQKPLLFSAFIVRKLDRDQTTLVMRFGEVNC